MLILRFMRRALIILILFFTLLIGSIPINAQLADSPSPTYRVNQKRNGLSPYTTNIETPHLKWKFNCEHGIESSPAIGPDGTIYTGTFSDNFFAINPDGTEKWRYTREDVHFRSSPTLDEDGTIYFIAAIDLIEEYNPTFDGYDYFGKPTLIALNPDGSLKWQFVTGGLASGILYSPAIGSDGTIYAISGGAKKGGTTDDPNILKGDNFYAINPDGTKKWNFSVGDAQYSAPAIDDDGTIYFGCADKNFYALNPDGTEKWRFNTSGEGIGPFDSFSAVPSIGPDGTIYCGSKNYNLYAINPDGTKKWHFSMLDSVECTPSFGPDGTIYCGAYSPSNDPYLYAIDPENGEEIWRFETKKGVYGSPTVDANGILYFGSDDKYFYSLNPDGTLRWKFITGGGLGMSPTIDSDGTVYFGGWDNHLYAIDGSTGIILEEDYGDALGENNDTPGYLAITLLIAVFILLIIKKKKI